MRSATYGIVSDQGLQLRQKPTTATYFHLVCKKSSITRLHAGMLGVSLRINPEGGDVCLLLQVYDATSFLKEHPGGGDSILLVAGTDATEEFDAIHSEKAKKQLLSFAIGRLAATKAGAIYCSRGIAISSKLFPCSLARRRLNTSKIGGLQMIPSGDRPHSRV